MTIDVATSHLQRWVLYCCCAFSLSTPKNVARVAPIIIKEGADLLWGIQADFSSYNHGYVVMNVAIRELKRNPNVAIFIIRCGTKFFFPPKLNLRCHRATSNNFDFALVRLMEPKVLTVNICYPRRESFSIPGTWYGVC